MSLTRLSTDKVAGSKAIEELEARRNVFPASEVYPFLIGDAEELARLESTAEFDDRDPDEILQVKVDPDKWFAERRAEAEENETDEQELLGTWPQGPLDNKGAISVHRDVLTLRIKPEVYVGLAAIDEPWQLPAVLRYGGWNECPGAETHCALFRRWQERYGAEIAAMSGDVVECLVSRPPNDRDSAIALAWEHYWYCPDIVDQGCDSVCNLAALLLNAKYWYFWWD